MLKNCMGEDLKVGDRVTMELKVVKVEESGIDEIGPYVTVELEGVRVSLDAHLRVVKVACDSRMTFKPPELGV